MKAYRKTPKGLASSQNSDYKRHYGITLQTYAILLKQQQGLCAICQRSCSSGYKLGVDHDHKTGEVRGLLCTKCNAVLGMVNDSQDILIEAIKYLDKAQMLCH